MDSLKTGTILHGKNYDYKIVRTLGQGTFGITYLASVKMTGELGSLDSEILVAIKEFFMRDFNVRNENSVTYSSTDGAFAYYKSKFIREAENLSNLHDSGIIKVIESFEENQTAYYVMEYVSEGSLDEHIKSKGFLSPAESVAYAIQIAKALGYMHQNQMLHLDLKPENIMIRENNNIVLIDFSLSKRFDPYGKPETITNICHGTPGYAPVEQANYQENNGGEFPATMDIYALGATMFTMLTGHRPPEASIIFYGGFPYSELQGAGVPQSIIDIVAKCMEPLQKNRYKTIQDVIHALTLIETGSTIYGGDTSVNGSYKKTDGNDGSKHIHTELFVAPQDTFEISVSFTPCQIGVYSNSNSGFRYTINERSLCADNLSLSVKIFQSLLQEIENIGIHVGITKEETHNYSETPAKLTLKFNSKSNGAVRLSLLAFNKDMIAGNIYDANIIDLAELIRRIFLKYLPKQYEPTRELIYSIPTSTSEIWIDYSEGGIVGFNTKHVKLGITNNKQQTGLENNCIYSPEELSKLVNGLRLLNLRSKDKAYVEPPTGITFPTLIISLFDSNDRLLKKFYAQDNGYAMIGDVAMPVKRLKNELAKLSKSFNAQLTDTTKEEVNHARKSLSDVIFRFVFLSVVIGIFALPTYLFAKPTDKLFLWLWATIGITELFSAILFSIGGINKTSGQNNFESISFIIGVLALVVYIVLWIIQICYWF